MNTFGRLFKISIFGESHGHKVGILIDGCPPGISLDMVDFEKDLSRRRSGAKGTTPRKESDQVILSAGVFEGKTTGAPLLLEFQNQNIRSKDYSSVKDVPRPGHADFTSSKKYKGFNDYRGGGHFSGRLTLGLVAAGVIAKKIIQSINISARVLKAGAFEDVERGIDEAIIQNDSIGALLECRAIGLPIGLGEPFFDSLESKLAHLVFSIPAIKGIEFGAGFSSVGMTGSQMNDPIIDENGKTSSNNSGGINGGISNGNELVFRVAVKPASSIALPQETFNFKTKQMTQLEIEGRHDLCIGLRVPPVLEAITAIVLADLFLLRKAAV